MQKRMQKDYLIPERTDCKSDTYGQIMNDQAIAINAVIYGGFRLELYYDVNVSREQPLKIVCNNCNYHKQIYLWFD